MRLTKFVNFRPRRVLLFVLPVSVLLLALFATAGLLTPKWFGVVLRSVHAQGNPSQIGQWDTPFATNSLMVHASVLPNGLVVFWDAKYQAEGLPQSYLLDPATQTQTALNLPLRSQNNDPTNPTINNIFCAGLSLLPSGNLLVTGGQTNLGIGFGLNYSNVFNFAGNGGAGSWDDTTPSDMAHGRWYPTNTQLGYGTILVLSGTEFSGYDYAYNPPKALYTFVFTPEIWEPTGPGIGYWRSLPGPTDDQVLPFYPWVFVDPRVGHEGWVYAAGPSTNTSLLNTHDTGTWSVGPLRSGTYDSARYYGSAVQYGPGRYLVVGGRGDGTDNFSTSTAEVLNLYDTTPTWRATYPMQNGRKYMNATILPNGRILATGGTNSTCGGETDENNAVKDAELWDPGTELWSYAGTTSEARLYHSVALLLPDARVLIGGGGEGGSCSGAGFDSHQNAQIYEPAYLFQGSRPIIGG